MRFLLDHNLAPQWGRALDVLDGDNSVVPLRDQFAPDTPDEEWLTTIGQGGDWAFLTGDTRIVRSPITKAAFVDARVPGFFLHSSWEKQRWWERTWKIVRWWPFIVEQAERTDGGAAFRLRYGRVGKFEIIRTN